MADLIPQADLSLPAEARSLATGPAVVQDDWARASFSAVYPIIRRLGTGASGAVFLARDNALHRMVALKILAPDLARDPAVCERFRQEARVNARLCHPNIVPIHAIGERAGTAYVVMRFVPGDSLAQHVWRGERWPVDQVARAGPRAQQLAVGYSSCPGPATLRRTRPVDARPAPTSASRGAARDPRRPRRRSPQADRARAPRPRHAVHRPVEPRG